MASSAAMGVPVKRVDESLLKSGVAIMPGGEDQLGRAIVVFPTTTPEMMRQRHTTAHMVLLLRYYVAMTGVVKRNGGIAVIANLTTYSSKDVLQIVVDTLDKLQAEIYGSVGILYAVLPRSKEAQKSLKKLLGLKPSKKNPKVPTYEAVLLDSVQELQRHIQRRHLTSDFGGTMTYNHRIWAQLTQDAEDLDEAVTSALRRVPDAVDKVAMMSEYDLPVSVTESEALLLQVRSKYNYIMRDINLEHLIDKCKGLHEKLSAPHKHEGYNDITQTVTFTETKVKVVDYRNRLTSAREKLKSLWQQAEDRIMLASKVNKYKVKAEKVTEWMQNVGLPTVNQDSDIADCLSKAEIFKNHFETGFLSIAKNVLWLAEKILKKFESLLQECGHAKQQQNGGLKSQTEPTLAYTRQFQATVEYFKRAVEKKHQVYLNVHAFFLSAVKASSEDKETSLSIYRQLQKLTKWYRHTLKFLPVQLLISSPRHVGSRPVNAAPYISSAWRAAIEDFILHHPLPSSENLTKMKNVIPVIDNINIRNQARLLISRVTVIRSLLVTPEHLSLRDLQDVILWREQMNQGKDEIYLNMTTSTMDLSKLIENDGRSNANPGHVSARLWQPDSSGFISSETESTSTTDGGIIRTPKLRLSGVTENVYFDEQLDGTSQMSKPHSKKHVHVLNAKKGRRRDHRSPVRASQSEHNIHLVGQQAAAAVPRLDLRGITKSSNAQKSYTDRGGGVERKQSFGIYGDVDDPRRRPPRPRNGRSMQNLASTLDEEDLQQQQRTDKELYVSLHGAETVGESELPSSLKHIDINALKKNLPQDHRTIQAPLIHSNDQRSGRPHSYESLVDSGIAHTHSSGDGSGVSVSTNGLSPNYSAGHGRMTALQEGDEQGLDVQQQSHPLNPSLAHAYSLPNLAYEKDGRLRLVQNNIDIIVNSQLAAEDKLKLMASMCDCESVHSNQIRDLNKSSLSKPVNGVTDSEVPPFNSRNHLEFELSENTVTSTLAEMLSESHLNNTKRSANGDVNSRSQGARSRTPKLYGAKDSELQSTQQGNHQPVSGTNIGDGEQKYHSLDAVVSNNARHQGPSETLLTAKHADLIQGNEDFNALSNYVKSAGFGIDIEAWMRNQEEGSEVLLAEAGEIDETEDGMAEYMEKWKHAKENRKTDEEDLMKARETLDDLRVHEEQLKQDAVEQSLTRTHHLLQEQEDILHGEQTQMVAATSVELLPHSESSLSSGTDTPSPALHPDTVIFRPDSLQVADVTIQQDSSQSSGSGSPPREVYDSSVSGESGVFTLNSTDFRLMKALDASNSANSTPRQGLSSAKRKLSQKESLNARVDLSSTSSGTSCSKSGIVKQMDFRDMLQSISAEKEQEEKEFQTAIKDGNSLKYAETLNESIANKCKKLDRALPKEPDQNTDEATSFPGLIHPSDSGISRYEPVMRSPEGNEMDGNPLSSKKHLPSISGSDVADDVFGSGDSTPVNTPRSGTQNLKKWNSLDVSQMQIDKNQNMSDIQRYCDFKPETDLNENVSQPQASAPLKTNNEIDHFIESKENNCSAANSVSQMSVSSSTCEAVHDQNEYLGDTAERSEVKEHAHMKVKVAAGGGSAWTNAFPIASHSMELANLKTPIIIDNGSGMCKCGFADQDLPSAIFPALVGRAKYEDVSVGRMEEHYVGSGAQNMRGVLKLQYPLEHGIITDWADMELIWQHAFEDQLRINPAEHPVLVTEAPLNPRKNREQMMELLFETFQVPGVYFAIQAVLALYASGRTTGIVVDSGDGVSHFVPIYEGYALPHAIKRLNLAGRDLTQYMTKLLYEKGHTFTTSAEHEIVRDMKEQHCFVSKDFTGDLRKAETSSDFEEFYTLPDGRSVSLNAERFRCPEVLFDPSLIGHEHGGIHFSTFNSVYSCDVDLRQELFSNIVLSGGTTMLPGFEDRLQEEVAALVPPSVVGNVQVTSPKDRYFSVWQGGAVLASLPSFANSWVSYEEYLDMGSNIVHLKCF